MVALDFPDAPTNGQVFDKWTWNGTQWVLTSGITTTAWAPVTFQNAWTNTSGGREPTQYRKVEDRVEVRMAMSTGASNTVAFTLPTGFRPLYLCWRPLVGAGAFAYAEVATDGTVKVLGTASIAGGFTFSVLG